MTDTASELEALVAALGAPQEYLRMRPGLARMQELCAKLGHPEQKVPVIQIVGTNGKGSTAFYLSQMLMSTLGGPIGSYFSPHYQRVNERIRLNSKEIGDAELLAALKEVQKAAQTMVEKPSFFEVLTMAAFLIFAKKKVRVAVMEAGLGGRYDATSVAAAEMGIITEVGLDHCHILGNTIPLILQEKIAAFGQAKIIIAGPQSIEARQELDQYSGPARLLLAGRDFDIQEDDRLKVLVKSGQGEWLLPREVPGYYRRRALGLALLAAAIWAKNLNHCLELAKITAELEISFPGRLQIISKDPLIIADIAHNPPAVKSLLNALKEIKPAATQKKWLLIFATMKDKDYAENIKLLAPLATHFILPDLALPRAASPDLLAEIIKNFSNTSAEIVADISAACQKATTLLATGKYAGLLITGSNFLAGPASRILKN